MATAAKNTNNIHVSCGCNLPIDVSAAMLECLRPGNRNGSLLGPGLITSAFLEPLGIGRVPGEVAVPVGRSIRPPGIATFSELALGGINGIARGFETGPVAGP